MNTQTAIDMLNNADHDALLDALTWQVDMGVTWAVDDAPIDRFAEYQQQVQLATEKAQHRQAPPTPNKQSPNQQTPNNQTLGTSQSLEQATQIAGTVSDLSALHRAIDAFDGCVYKSTASRTVTHFGTLTPKLLIILNAPDGVLDTGGDFYAHGRGLMIKRMLDAIDVSTDDVCITHSVFWRPPGGTTPQDKNIKICQPLLLKQISLMNPDCVLCFGNTPLKSVLQNPDPIARIRGRWQKIMGQDIMGQDIRDDKTIPMMPTLAPDMLIKDPSRKRLVWQDLLALHAKIKGAL